MRGGIVKAEDRFNEKTMVKKIAAAMLCFLLCAGFAGCKNSIGTTSVGGTLRVGVRDFVPGFGYKNPDSGVYSGLEIDIAKALAKETGKNLELVPVDNIQRTEFIDDDTVDCVIATFSETEERKARYDFSVPYYTDYIRLLVENSSKINSVSDLKGLTVGVVENSTAAEALVDEMMRLGYIPSADITDFDARHFDGGISFKVYSDYDKLAYGLEIGAVDAAAGDGSLLIGYKNENRSFLADKFAEQHYGICMKKDSPLKSTADELVNRMLADGTLDEYIANHGLKE